MSTEWCCLPRAARRSNPARWTARCPSKSGSTAQPPEEVDFVRINGNRVIRVEIAKVGEPPVVFTKDVVSGMMRTDGTPVETAENHVHIIKEGDVQRDPDKEAPAPPPSLRNPGEKLPSDDANANNSGGQKNVGVMRPVQAPVKRPEYQPDANPDSVPDQPRPPLNRLLATPAPARTAAPARLQSQPRRLTAGASQPN